MDNKVKYETELMISEMIIYCLEYIKEEEYARQCEIDVMQSDFYADGWCCWECMDDEIALMQDTPYMSIEPAFA